MTQLEWKKIEEKWQKAWGEAKIFEASPDPRKEKFFMTVPYPYTSGPLHVGHGRTYTLGDIYVKFLRMRGLNVLWPMAFHITGTPILAISKRIEGGDQTVIQDHIEYVGLHNPKDAEEIVGGFMEPENVATYYASVISKDLNELGCSIDWRRNFTTGNPEYNQLIRWQYHHLNALNYLKKGEHPVFFCPSDNNPVTTDDIKGGDELELSITQFDLLKEPFDDGFLVAATLRSETIFGVTNVWVNPEAMYVKVKVDGEKWYVSEKCAEKLKNQNLTVEILERFKGKRLVGKEVYIPLAERKVKVLPAGFVDEEVATGVVNSVPAHAPYDLIALEDLKKDRETIKNFSLSSKEIGEIRPISLIQVEGLSEWPAADVSRKLHVESQRDVDKLEKATQEVYNLEYYNGVLREICGEFAGLRVPEGKSRIFEKLRGMNLATMMAENMTKDLEGRPVKEIRCRCGSKVFVKVLGDQWFLDYSSEEWKAKARRLLTKMEIYPEIYRRSFEFYIGWLHEWACTRTRGLGTRLPYDERWIIESLSDSTIYMAFYTIIHLVKQNKIQPEQLTVDLFDYVYLGEGNPEHVSKKTGVDVNLLKNMREAFLYWYPIDERRTAPMHISNHLTFFIFHHAAIFPENLWPKRITLNEALIAEGRKMSKSLGNVIPLVWAVREYGADTVRLYLSHAADASTTLDWRAENVKDLKSKLEALYNFCQQIISMQGGEEELNHMDRWLISNLQQRIRGVTENLENWRTRAAAENAFFETWNDLRWYFRRNEKPNARVLKVFLQTWVLLMTPFTPHLCQEIWRSLGWNDFILNQAWPIPDEAKIDVGVEEAETLMKALIEDTQSVIKATKITPKKICYYTAAPWKWKTYLRSLEKSISEKVTPGELLRELMADPSLRRKGAAVARFVQGILEEINRMPEDVKRRRLQAGIIGEKEVLNGAKGFFQREFNAEMDVYSEEDSERYDPRNRGPLAKPYRPAIFIE